MIKIKDIKKGDTFFECEYGDNVEYEAINDAYRAEQDSGWAVDGTLIGCNEVNANIGYKQRFYCSDKFEGYGPKLYWQEQYA